MREALLSRDFDSIRLVMDASASLGEGQDAQEFFKEILRSYRLIFGQTRSSRKKFQKLYGKSRSWSSGPNSDPLLQLICGRSCESGESSTIFAEIGADDASNHYDPQVDFPFLGKRLLGLQDYVRGHNPHNFKSLWYDRRNGFWWWSFWVSLFLNPP